MFYIFHTGKFCLERLNFSMYSAGFLHYIHFCKINPSFRVNLDLVKADRKDTIKALSSYLPPFDRLENSSDCLELHKKFCNRIPTLISVHSRKHMEQHFVQLLPRKLKNSARLRSYLIYCPLPYCCFITLCKVITWVATATLRYCISICLQQGYIMIGLSLTLDINFPYMDVL